MPDENAFLATIIKHIEDNGPRFVYADWLEETGKTQLAEFIRIDCQLDELHERIRQLQTRRGEIREGAQIQSELFHIHYDRGFPDGIYLNRDTLRGCMELPSVPRYITELIATYPIRKFEASLHSRRDGRYYPQNPMTDTERGRMWQYLLSLMLPLGNRIECAIGGLKMTPRMFNSLSFSAAELGGNSVVRVAGCSINNNVREMIEAKLPGRFMFEWPRK